MITVEPTTNLSCLRFMHLPFQAVRDIIAPKCQQGFWLYRPGGPYERLCESIFRPSGPLSLVSAVPRASRPGLSSDGPPGLGTRNHEELRFHSNRFQHRIKLRKHVVCVRPFFMARPASPV